MRIIKKYPNRRLYDTELGTYITLNDVKQLVLDHVVFQVIDARSKKDLTQSTLLQIIAEQEAQGPALFSSALLQDFIRFYTNKPTNNLLSDYLEQAMQLFTQQKDFFQEQWLSYQKFFSDPVMQKMWSNEKKGKK